MDLSVVIVNYNTKHLLRDCLNSIHETLHSLSYEIIVVDNGSRDGSVQMLKKEFPRVHIIKNSENLGFGAANNQAFRIMSGRYALLLNADTVLTENAVGELFSFMENYPEAAIACGQLLNSDGSKQNSIACFPTPLTLMINTVVLEYLLPNKYPSKRYSYKEPVEIDSGIGACLIVRKRAMDEVGLFDERYFFFFEETDWALRMKKAGWKIYFVPSALIYHLQGQAVGSGPESRIEFYRSRYQFFRKWDSLPGFYLISAVIFSRLLVNWLFTFLANMLTMCLSQKLRAKLVNYSCLLWWHFQGCPNPREKKRF